MITVALATIIVLILFKTVPGLKNIELDTFIAFTLVLAPGIIVAIIGLFIANPIVLLVVELLAYIGIPTLILKSGAGLPLKKALLLGGMVYLVVIVVTVLAMALTGGV